MLDKFIELLTSDSEERVPNNQIKKFNKGISDSVMDKAEDKVGRFMDNLPNTRLGSGYLNENYGKVIKPNFEFVVFPNRMCTMGQASAISKTPDELYDCERVTLIAQACSTFENLSGNMLTSMTECITQALQQFIAKHNAILLVPDSIALRINNSWLRMLESYQDPEVENMYAMRLTPNTIDAIASNMYIFIETGFLQKISDNFNDEEPNDTIDAVMEDYYFRYAPHIRSFIYDTLAELMRVASMLISSINKQGIDFDEYTKKMKYMPEE